MARDQPLSFLDHHLKCGNSLIGAQLADLGHYPLKKRNKSENDSQLGLFANDHDFRSAVEDAVRKYQQIETNETIALGDIGDKKEWLTEVNNLLRPYSAICDFHTSIFFENRINEYEYDSTLSSFSTDFQWQDFPCFHWELEFPEILLKGNGFSAVIENPPYINKTNLPNSTVNFFNTSNHYKYLYGRYDVYLVFLEKSIQLLDNGGVVTLILPRSFMLENYAKELRKHLVNDLTIKTMVDFNEIYLFQSASVHNCIISISKMTNTENDINVLSVTDYKSVGKLKKLTRKHYAQHNFVKNNNYHFRISNLQLQNLAERIFEKTIPLGDICYVCPGCEVHSEKKGLKKHEFISKIEFKENSKKYVEAKNKISRYSPIFSDSYLNYDPSMLKRPRFPELFESPKIMVRRITQKGQVVATFDKDWVYTDNTFIYAVLAYHLENVSYLKNEISEVKSRSSRHYSELYILGIINSKLINRIFSPLEIAGQDVYPNILRRVPIKEIPLKNQETLINLVDRMIKAKTQLYLEKTDQKRESIEHDIVSINSEIDNQIYAIYGLTDEDIQQVVGGSFE